jgi:hypothetical protein
MRLPMAFRRFQPFRLAITDPGVGACDTVVVSSEDFEKLAGHSAKSPGRPSNWR